MNMSYCRFQNTKGDFIDCLDSLEADGVGELSTDEFRAAKRLYELALDYVRIYEELDEDDEDNDETLFVEHYPDTWGMDKE